MMIQNLNIIVWICSHIIWNGLHVGHPEGYTATDIVSRMKRMQGYNVLHPMGFDSFGLPAEQFAIQTGHPSARNLQKKNIRCF